MLPPEIGNLHGLQTNAMDIPDDFNITDSNITIAEASKKDKGEPDSACCAGKENLKSLTFELTGGNCDASSKDQGNKFKCRGVFPTTSPFSVTVKDTKFKSGTPQGPFNLGDTFTIVPYGSRFDADTRITIGGQKFSIHTSCSQPLNLGDIFGGVEHTEDCQVFCGNTKGVGKGIDEGCPPAFPACIAPEDEVGEKYCVHQNTAGPFKIDEGCGGANPRLCFDGDKEPCYLEAGTQCLCIDDAEGESQDSGCNDEFPLCGRLTTNSAGSEFGKEASFPNVQGNLGNTCFTCQKSMEFPTATDADIDYDDDAPHCVAEDDGKLEDVGHLGFGCMSCQDVFYTGKKFSGTTPTHQDAVAPDGCILTPISSQDELNAVRNAAKSLTGRSRCWVGITAQDTSGTTRIARANNFNNPALA
jgi:hypothetical protein